MAAPLKNVSERKELPPLASPPEVSCIDSAIVALPKGAKPELVNDGKIVKLRVCGQGDGVDVKEALDIYKITRLGRKELDKLCTVTELEGKRPAYATVKFTPKIEKIRRRKGKGDIPANVFDTDDRFIFSDTSFPWRTTGRVWTAKGSGTGCTIGPRLVLTASHCVDWKDGNTAGWMKFSPGYNGGNGPWGEFAATNILFWNKADGPLSDLETAFDYVVLVMNDTVGDLVGWPGFRTYDTAWNGLSVWQHVGYPGDLANAQKPAFQGNCVVSTAEDEDLSGQKGLVLGHFNDTTSGHSGGPLWGWWDNEEWPRVVGVLSAGASVPKRDTSGDNEFGGGSALSALISYARSEHS